MKFFGTNELYINLGGTSTASSNTAVSDYAFDEDNTFSWTSDGEATDGNAINLDRTLSSTQDINRIFVKDTNISDLAIYVDVGAGFVTLASETTFTEIKSDAGDQYYFELDTTLSIDAIRITGSNTIIANSEKEVTQFLAFVELGEIEYNDDVQPTRTRKQVISELNSGKFDIINKGRYFELKIKLKAHYKSADNSIINTLLQREKEVWIWLNDNQEDIIYMPQEPFRFGDIYKMAFQKKDQIKFTKNAWFSGLDVTLDYAEVA